MRPAMAADPRGGTEPERPCSLLFWLVETHRYPGERRKTGFAMLDKFLHQEQFPSFTTLSILTSLLVWAAIIAAACSSHNGFEGLGSALLAMLALMVGCVLNVIWGLIAHNRGEYCGFRIAMAGVALPVVVLIGWSAVSGALDEYHSEAAEHSSMWGAMHEVFVQPDGKLVLIGAGLVRLLPDGQRDASYHRDYSFARRGSFPDFIRTRWPDIASAAMAPNGDLILAYNGWIGRVRADGRDATLVHGGGEWKTCWGLAVQPDGKILAGWNGPHGDQFSRLLSDGSVDPSFRAAVAPMGSGKFAVQSDGRIVLVGATEQVGSGCFNRLVRLNADGSLDETFGFRQPCLPSNLVNVRSADLVAAPPDGSILVRMGSYEHGSIDEMIYLDRDGKGIENPGLVDALLFWFPGNHKFTAAVPVSDGRFLVVHAGLVRVLRDGTLDDTFHLYGTLSNPLVKVLMQGEKIIVVDGSGGLVRLTGDGSPDPTFRMPALKVYSD
jgi:uncharacterized delta-60 repeat protein